MFGMGHQRTVEAPAASFGGQGGQLRGPRAGARRQVDDVAGRDVRPDTGQHSRRRVVVVDAHDDEGGTGDGRRQRVRRQQRRRQSSAVQVLVPYRDRISRGQRLGQRKCPHACPEDGHGCLGGCVHHVFSPRLLRYYEQQGLLAPRREPSGYRSYDDGDIVRVHRIRALLAAGLDTTTIAYVLPCTIDTGNGLAAACEDLLVDLRRERNRIADTIGELVSAAEALDSIITATHR